eukprot:7550703-Alexandrium_andersonii.AAC.1
MTARCGSIATPAAAGRALFSEPPCSQCRSARRADIALLRPRRPLACAADASSTTSPRVEFWRWVETDGVEDMRPRAVTYV